jgi:VWFA-related protein
MLRLLLGLLAASLLAGDEAPKPDSRLIDLNVIALDAHGEPVTDLTADDFQVTDAGKSRTLSFFRHNGAQAEQIQPPGLNEFTNRVNGEPTHATVLLFDLMNEGFSSRGTAANEIVRYLQTLESADSLYFYILTINGRLVALRPIPEEGAAPPAPGTPPWTRQIRARIDEALKSLTANRSSDIDVAGRVQLTYTALNDLGGQLSTMPGRKNVVWVTDGVPIALGRERSDTGEPVDFTPQLRQLSESLDRDGVALYPVRQVMLGSPDEIGAESGVGQTGGAGIGVQSISTLNEFADVTGGRPSTDPDIGKVLKQAMLDLRSSYQIGYYAPSDNWNSKFHKLKLVCKRKGVRLQAKTGYYAWPEPVGTRAQQAFAATAGAAFDAGEIGMRASVSEGRRLSVRIDAKDIALVQDGAGYSGQLRIQTVGYLPEARNEVSPVSPVDLHLTSEQRDQALKDGIEFAQDVKLGQEMKFRVIVFDRSSNSVGSVTVPATAFRR